MPPRGPKIISGRFSKKQRIRRRKGINLEEAALGSQTRSRYYIALKKLTPALRDVQSLAHMDELVCDWIHDMWATGEPLLTIGDALSALHYFQPFTRRGIPHSWKLFATWRKVEVPSRAPPLTEVLVRSISAYELHHNRLEMATCLMLAFYALLRTGELLALTTEDVLLGKQAAVISLHSTKTSKRYAAHDAISIQDPFVLELLRTLLQVRKDQGLIRLGLWSGTHQHFRSRFKRLTEIYGVQNHHFRPYSLRRGGATRLFQETGSMELVLTKGRWESSKVAKMYISDALSYLPSIKLSNETKLLLQRFHFISPTLGWVFFAEEGTWKSEAGCRTGLHSNPSFSGVRVGGTSSMRLCEKEFGYLQRLEIFSRRGFASVSKA